MGARAISTYSMWSLFRNCRKACEWRYLHELVPLERDRNLALGTVVHQCLEVPDEDVLAHGTADPLADVATQARLSGQRGSSPGPDPKSATVGAWGAVYGELLTFDDPETRLPPIDRLEGFRPGGSSLYRRVLVPAKVNGACELAWVYTVETTRIKRRRIVSGRWPE